MRELKLRFLSALGLAVTTCVLASGTAQARALDHLLATDDIGQNKIPNQGTSHILVIPVHVGPEGFPQAELTKLQQEFASDGAFRKFWQDVSGGRYDPIPTLVAPVEYPDSCPIPGRTVSNCTVSLGDTDLFGGGLAATFENIIARVRDEQQIDLSDFDVNSAAGASPDGYFDGVIGVTNIATGVSLPLAPLFNELTMASGPGNTGSDITLSLVALAPPIQHEFAHMFGFIDLYGGPTVNGLMSETVGTLSAFSRQQVGWAEVTQITESVEIELPPVLDSGMILRIGDAPRYMLIENRGGALHAGYEECAPGIYVYSIAEDTLADGPLHFIDVLAGTLNLPNAEPPYMNVAMPLDCATEDASKPTACVLDEVGDERILVHADGFPSGYTLRIVDTAGDGTITVQIFDASGPPQQETPPATGGDDEGGCDCALPGDHDGSRPAAWWSLALVCVLWLRRRMPVGASRR